MAITENTDYLGEAQGRLLQQFKRRPRIDGFLTAFMGEAQDLESAMWAVYVDRQLQSNLASGDMLDKLGKIVGQARNGLADADYLIFITARIAANRSDGKRETLIKIALLLNSQSTPILFREYVKAVEIEANSVTANAYIVWRDFLYKAKAAGTALWFFFSQQDKAHTLTRTSVSGGVTTVSTQRKGSVSVGGIGGGVFAGVFGA